jgi:hypothetical protein
MSEEINYPSWWNDPYGERHPPLLDDDTDDDHFYITEYGYLYEGSMQGRDWAPGLID